MTPLVLSALLATSLAQVPRDAATLRPSGTAVLAGVVTTLEVSPRPLRRAIVTLSGGGLAASIQTVTNDAGRFAFADLPAGRYTLMAYKPAYVRTYYGSRRPGRGPATPISLAEGQRVTDVRIALLRGAAIEGVVLDQNGVPQASAQVTVLRPAIVNGERRLVNADSARPWATTDDRGWYRHYGLPPGEYTVRASTSNGILSGTRLTTAAAVEAALRGTSGEALPSVAGRSAYFPAAADASQAEFVTLAAGEERAGVDVAVSFVRASRIEGVMITQSGQPVQSALVGIANLSTGGMWGSPGIVRPARDGTGRFSMRSMLPGRYLFFGRASVEDVDATPDANLPLWTSTEVLVSEQEVVDVALHFLPGASVSGRIVAEAAGSALDATKLRVALAAAPAVPGTIVPPAPVSPQADGSFTFAGVPPGKYRVTLVGPAAGWTLRSAVVDGRDAADVPLEVSPGRDVSGLRVTLTDRPTEISGALFDHLNRPAPEYGIVVFSTDPAHWTTAPRRMSGIVKVGVDGSFVVRGLPPGEYFLTAITDLDPAQLNDPAFLELLSSASLKITLGEGEKKVQNLKLPSSANQSR